MLEIIHGAEFSQRTRALDASCGEGVFLRVAGERGKVAADCLLGSDLDEALDEGWRRDSLLKHARLHIANGLLDQPACGVRAGASDPLVGKPPFAGKGVRDRRRLLDAVDTTVAAPEPDFFGALGVQDRSAPFDPPLTPPERVELDRLAKQLGRYTCWRLSEELTGNGEIDAPDASGLDDSFSGRGESRWRNRRVPVVRRAAWRTSRTSHALVQNRRGERRSEAWRGGAS